MSTEAKIKHLPGQIDAALDRIERRLTITAAQTELLAAELRRNRRLLEAGERLKKVCMRLEEFTTPSKRDWENAAVTDEFWSMRQEATKAVRAYQEAAKS